MAHINICLNHIKNAGYTKHFTEEETILSSFEIISSEEMVKLILLTRQNKKIEKTVTYSAIEDIVTLVILGNKDKITHKIDVSPNVEQIQPKQKTNMVTTPTSVNTDKIKTDGPTILENTKKVNDILFNVIDGLNESVPTSLYINKAKAISQAAQVILNAAKIEMDLLKRVSK